MVNNKTAAIAVLSMVLFAMPISTVALPAAHAYGKSDWQVAFSGTGTTPKGGGGFGFWGWCAFTGKTSGDDGDCEFSQYVHSADFSVTCEVSLEITSWSGGFTGDFIVTGHATVHPSSASDACLSVFPGSADFSGLDSEIPAIPGHYNIKNPFGPTGTLQMQVVFIG